MRTLRATLYREVVAVLVAWSLLMLLVQTFKGGSVGGPACYTDPTCGEIGWIPTAFWIIGILVILVVGFALRPERLRSADSGSGPTDKVVAVALVLGTLAIVAVALTLYQDSRPIS